MPLIGETLAYVLALHLREQIRHDAFGVAELSAGRVAAAGEATVCFADMVDFTPPRRDARAGGARDA